MSRRAKTHPTSKAAGPPRLPVHSPPPLPAHSPPGPWLTAHQALGRLIMTVMIILGESGEKIKVLIVQSVVKL